VFVLKNTKHQTPNTKKDIIMHEMGIAMQIIEITTASIPADMQHVRVARVNLKVGKLAAIVPDSLRFCFEIAAQETPLAGAELVIEELPVVARCNDCDTEWTINGPDFICQKCKSGSIQLISGRELDIESIEVADED
jgi:hydrogenase nickel incorporation protein HypA/HybF